MHDEAPQLSNPFRFLAIGECMAELAPLEMHGDFRWGFAGDTFNTAWYLRQLRPDIRVAYHTSVGSDDLSASMIRSEDNEGKGALVPTCPEILGRGD